MQTKKIEEDIIYNSRMSGYCFHITDEKWELDKDVCIYPYKVTKKMPESMKEGYLQTLAYYASEFSSGYVKNINLIFLKWVNLMRLNVIDDKAIQKLHINLGPVKNYNLKTIKKFITKWKAFNYHGVDKTAIRMLEKINIVSNQTGEAVKRRDPNKGPFTEIEFNIILTSLAELYSENKIESTIYCFIHLLATTGRRPLQLTSLKGKDLIKKMDRYYLNIPRVKQKLPFRAEMEMKEIDGVLYENLRLLIEGNEKYLELNFHEGIHDLRGEIPVFLDIKKVKKCIMLSDIKNKLNSDYFHMRNQKLFRMMKSLSIGKDLKSERTKNNINLNARRFRYTLATRLASEGASISVIAKALDHKSISSSGIYVKNVPDNVRDIDSKIGGFLQPLANVFLGVESEINKDRFKKQILHSYALNDNSEKEIKCLRCKNLKPWRIE
jgi:integrase